MRLVHGRKSLTTREDEKTRRQPRPVRSQRPDSLPFGLRLPIDARLGQSETPDFLEARSDDNSSPVVPMGWPVIVYILPLAARGDTENPGRHLRKIIGVAVCGAVMGGVAALVDALI